MCRLTVGGLACVRLGELLEEDTLGGPGRTLKTLRLLFLLFFRLLLLKRKAGLDARQCG